MGNYSDKNLASFIFSSFSLSVDDSHHYKLHETTGGERGNDSGAETVLLCIIC